MDFTRKAALGACLVVLLMGAGLMKARTAEDAGRKEIEAFNKRYLELHLNMDTAGILGLWAEDGVDLIPGDAPMVGRNEDCGVGGRHRGQDAGVQNDEDGVGVSGYSRVRGLGFGVGERASSDAAAGREADDRGIRENGAGAASRGERGMEGSARDVERFAETVRIVIGTEMD